MDQALYYHAIAQTSFGDLRRIEKIKRKFGNWKRAYDRLRRTRHAIVDAHKAWSDLARLNIDLVLADDARYPPLLREMPDPPFGLYYKGSLPARPARSLAIVGTRRATPGGKATAKRFALAAGRAGITIVSGLAFGIDAAAHEGALDAGGKTIAVLAGGLHGIYPREHASLAQKILSAGGAIASEYPPGQDPLPYRFIERNRIVSGLAEGTLIVEAPEGSGSLATARFALEQNRNVYVIPGSIDHANFAGSHTLIRQGATLVTKPEDIFADYNLATDERSSIASRAENAQETQVLTALAATNAPIDVDKIAIMTKLEARIITRTLSFLLLRGVIKEEGAGYTI